MKGNTSHYNGIVSNFVCSRNREKRKLSMRFRNLIREYCCGKIEPSAGNRGGWQGLSQEHPQQSLLRFTVGVVANGEVEVDGFFQDAFGVREGVKTGFPVVATHAAFADSAKGHIGRG